MDQNKIHLLTKDELMTSKGIGASDIAAVLHESPWMSAFELWQIKTGRREKKPQTEAMKFGQTMEETAMAAYFAQTGYAPQQFQQQVIARHPDLPFLRCIADGYSEELKRLVDVKVPSGRSLLNSMESGEIPRNYLLQIAAEMDIFHVQEFDFAVYDAKESSIEIATVTWDYPWDATRMLTDLWYETALLMLTEFWDAVQADEWIEETDQVFVPDELAWIAAMAERNNAIAEIERHESLKNEAEAEIKRVLGRHLVASAAGWKAKYTYYKPTHEIKIILSNVEATKKILAALDGLRQTEGVKSIKAVHQPESYRFGIETLKP